ncbi:MAG TPA: alpha/beta fold hydrolase [Phycisphaerae bacterium]|nr:alpha/beta fold hydrolase [Phycisphaerae bacterium]HRR87506.1 alpha/beta fold hydrolase [Phycisphaerae bacterium]
MWSSLLAESGVLAGAWWEYLARNWALASIVSTLACLLLISWLILRKYIKIMFNIIRDTPPPLAMGPCDFERIDGERVVFRAFDNIHLCGMFLFGDHGGHPKGMVIFAHEFSSDMYSCARYCRPLLKAGYNVFSFDFRGHGESSLQPGYQPRQWPTNHELNDMLGAIAYVEDWLESRGFPLEVGLFGISRGAGAAILAAQNNKTVKAIIADGAFSSDTTLEHLMKRWAYIFAKVRFVYENHPPQFWRFLRWLLFCECRKRLNCTFPSVRKALARMEGPRPILFIHGERDSYIPVEQSQLLYESAPGPKFLWIVPGAKHNQSAVLRPDQYAARTVAFFDYYLAGAGTEQAVERVLRSDSHSGEPVKGLSGVAGQRNVFSRLDRRRRARNNSNRQVARSADA